MVVQPPNAATVAVMAAVLHVLAATTSGLRRQGGGSGSGSVESPCSNTLRDDVADDVADAWMKRVEVIVDFSSRPIINASTASTVEVDVMPFLGRTAEGGPFNAYVEALSNLGSDFVRYAPWYPYPQVVVTELKPPDCTATKPATNWNSSLFDGIMRDFMYAVCGANAVNGACEHSVAQQLSTMPDWLYQDAYPVPNGTIPEDPWQYKSFCGYDGAINNQTDTGNSVLNDETCSELAAYMTRLVAHYTAGGHHDSCGHWHNSGFHYNWSVLSVLNENERNTMGPRYTRCFDAIRESVARYNPTIKLAGPEIVLGAQGAYTHYFLDPANHKDKKAPEIISNHAFFNSGAGEFFTGVDQFMPKVADLVAARDAKAPSTELVLNEFIPVVQDWCDAADAAKAFVEHGDALDRDPQSAGCPNWQSPASQSVGINRKTIGWNAAAACFAYGYGRLAAYGYKYVGADQLIGGVWPDNEPGVSCLDWKSGQPNAKYWAINMLAKALGSGLKSFLNATVRVSGPPPPPAKVGTVGSGTCGVTLICEEPNCCDKQPKGSWAASTANISTLAECAAKAKSCSQANFVSFSKPQNDCSWYKSCDMQHLLRPGNWQGESEVIHEVPPSPTTPEVFALPWIRHYASANRGVLLVNKASTPTTIQIIGEQALLQSNGWPTNATTALVLDGTIDGLTVEEEPGFVPPVERMLAADGSLTLGPFGVALVRG